MELESVHRAHPSGQHLGSKLERFVHRERSAHSNDLRAGALKGLRVGAHVHLLRFIFFFFPFLPPHAALFLYACPQARVWAHACLHAWAHTCWRACVLALAFFPTHSCVRALPFSTCTCRQVQGLRVLL